MDRLNSEGIARHKLKVALSDRPTVLSARRTDTCLLCRRPRVNEAGLCDVCWALLDDDELRLAGKWLMGQGPEGW